VICPNCSAGEISPLTHCCEMCGFVPDASVIVEAPQAETVDDFARLELAGHFRLDACFGHGATAAVYLARELHSERQIVVKALLRPADGRAETDARFARAVEAVAALEHPHIVPVFAHGATEHLYWYSMEHVRGRSLREYLDSRAALELKSCLRIATQVASALDHAHRLGIVHGALKPENVLIDAEGWVHVCDLLVTSALKPPAPRALPGEPALPAPLQAATEMARSPYAAPEDLTTPFSDQYSLAALIYECLAKAPPPGPDHSDVTPASSLAQQRPEIPPYMALAIARALSRKPIDRFPGVLDFVAALESQSVPAPEAQPSGQTAGAVLIEPDWEPPPRTMSKRLVIAGVVMAVVVFAGGALALALRRSPPALAPFATMGTDTMSAGARRPRPLSDLDTMPRLPGRLFVNASPWGQLYLDGQLIGNTPRANISLDPGTHTVTVVREGYNSFVRVIRVAPRDTVRLTDIVLTPRSP
jgi:serine/threonine-protein kinase